MVTVNGDFTFGGTGSGDNLTLSGPVALSSGSHVITVGDTGGAATTATVSGTVSGSSVTGIEKAGPGTLVLSSVNDYTGTTTVSGGTLRLGISNAIPTTTTLTVKTGGTFDLFGFLQTVASLVGTAPSTLTNTGAADSTFTFGDGNDTTFAGLITNATNALNLVKQGSGTLTLSGASDYTGTTTINTGAVIISNSTALGSTAGGTIVSPSTSLELINNITVGAEPLSVAGTGVASNGALLNLSGTNTYGGTVTLTDHATIQSDAGTLTLNASPSVTGAGKNLTVTGVGNTTISGAITTGAGSLVKTGTGTLVLGGTNTFSNGLVINSGKVSVSADVNLGDSAGGVTFGGPSTLAVTDNLTTTPARLVTVSAAATIDVAAGKTATLNGTVTGTGGSLTKAGTGILVLSGTNDYAGGTNISAGTLSVSADENLGASGTAVTFSGTGTLRATGALTTNRPVALNASATVDVTSSNVATLNGAISGTVAGSLTKTGTGTLVLGSTDNSYLGGTTLGGGTLSVSDDRNLGDSSGGVTFSNTATLAVTGDFTSNRTVAANAAATFDVAADKTATFNNTVSGTGGSLTKTGAGNLVLAGNNSYAGGTTINSGTLSVSSNNNLGNTSGGVNFSGPGTLAATGTFSTSRSFGLNAAGTFDVAATKTLTVAGSFNGSSSLTKTGAGTLAVTSNNSLTYSGQTIINGGTYLANNSSGSATGTGDVTVNASGTLGGTGRVSGHVQVNAGGTLSPGASIGTLLTGALDLGADSTLKLEINTGTLAADLVRVTGNLTLAAGALLTVTDLNLGTNTLVENEHLTIATYSGALSGLFRVPGYGYDITDYNPLAGNVNAVHFFLNDGTPLAIDYNYSDPNFPGVTSVSLVVVPEPGAMASLAGAAGLLLGLQRFRRRNSKV
jgi:autotransporter-associated beta strand protein